MAESNLFVRVNRLGQENAADKTYDTSHMQEVFVTELQKANTIRTGEDRNGPAAAQSTFTAVVEKKEGEDLTQEVFLTGMKEPQKTLFQNALSTAERFTLASSVNVGGNHWVSVVYKFDGGNVTPYYFNSAPSASGLTENQLPNFGKNKLPMQTIENGILQDDGISCGPISIKNSVAIAAGINPEQMFEGVELTTTDAGKKKVHHTKYKDLVTSQGVEYHRENVPDHVFTMEAYKFQNYKLSLDGINHEINKKLQEIRDQPGGAYTDTAPFEKEREIRIAALNAAALPSSGTEVSISAEYNEEEREIFKTQFDDSYRMLNNLQERDPTPLSTSLPPVVVDKTSPTVTKDPTPNPASPTVVKDDTLSQSPSGSPTHAGPAASQQETNKTAVSVAATRPKLTEDELKAQIKLIIDKEDLTLEEKKYALNQYIPDNYTLSSINEYMIFKKKFESKTIESLKSRPIKTEEDIADAIYRLEQLGSVHKDFDTQRKELIKKINTTKTDSSQHLNENATIDELKKLAPNYEQYEKARTRSLHLAVMDFIPPEKPETLAKLSLENNEARTFCLKEAMEYFKKANTAHTPDQEHELANYLFYHLSKQKSASTAKSREEIIAEGVEDYKRGEHLKDDDYKKLKNTMVQSAELVQKNLQNVEVLLKETPKTSAQKLQIDQCMENISTLEREHRSKGFHGGIEGMGEPGSVAMSLKFMDMRKSYRKYLSSYAEEQIKSFKIDDGADYKALAHSVFTLREMEDAIDNSGGNNELSKQLDPKRKECAKKLIEAFESAHQSLNLSASTADEPTKEAIKLANEEIKKIKKQGEYSLEDLEQVYNHLMLVEAASQGKKVEELKDAEFQNMDKYYQERERVAKENLLTKQASMGSSASVSSPSTDSVEKQKERLKILEELQKISTPPDRKDELLRTYNKQLEQISWNGGDKESDSKRVFKDIDGKEGLVELRNPAGQFQYECNTGPRVVRVPVKNSNGEKIPGMFETLEFDEQNNLVARTTPPNFDPAKHKSQIDEKWCENALKKGKAKAAARESGAVSTGIAPQAQAQQPVPSVAAPTTPTAPSSTAPTPPAGAAAAPSVAGAASPVTTGSTAPQPASGAPTPPSPNPIPPQTTPSVAAAPPVVAAPTTPTAPGATPHQPASGAPTPPSPNPIPPQTTPSVAAAPPVVAAPTTPTAPGATPPQPAMPNSPQGFPQPLHVHNIVPFPQLTLPPTPQANVADVAIPPEQIRLREILEERRENSTPRLPLDEGARSGLNDIFQGDTFTKESIKNFLSEEKVKLRDALNTEQNEQNKYNLQFKIAMINELRKDVGSDTDNISEEKARAYMQVLREIKERDLDNPEQLGQDKKDSLAKFATKKQQIDDQQAARREDFIQATYVAAYQDVRQALLAVCPELDNRAGGVAVQAQALTVRPRAQDGGQLRR